MKKVKKSYVNSFAMYEKLDGSDRRTEGTAKSSLNDLVSFTKRRFALSILSDVVVVVNSLLSASYKQTKQSASRHSQSSPEFGCAIGWQFPAPFSMIYHSKLNERNGRRIFNPSNNNNNSSDVAAAAAAASADPNHNNSKKQARKKETMALNLQSLTAAT